MKYWLHINFVPEKDLESAINYYKNKGDNRYQKIYTINHPYGKEIINEKTFLEAIVYSFPLDPPILVGEQEYIYDAVKDSLLGGITSEELDIELIDIVWPNISQVASISIQTLIHGVDFLLNVSGGFSDYFFQKKRTYCRILLIYDDNDSKFSSEFW